MIEKGEIEYMAKLARLALGPEKESLRKDLSDILDYVDKLQSINVADTESVRLDGTKNISRNDIEKDFDDKDVLIESFSEKEGRFLKVRSIL